MKRVLPVLLWTALSSCIFAQVYGPPRSVPNAPGVIVDPGFGSRMAATVAGRPVPMSIRGGHGSGIGPGYRGGHAGSRGVGHPRHSNTVVVPYPVVVGGGYGYGYDNGFYDPGPAAAPDAGAYYDGSNAQQPPVVIINQNFRPETVNPVVRDYSNSALPPASNQSGLKTYENPTHPYADALQQPQPQQAQEPPKADDEKPTIYLLAFKDHTIIPALAYWVDGDTLNYITKNGIQNRASLSLIDKDFSKELNDERHVEFKLPAQ